MRFRENNVFLSYCRTGSKSSKKGKHTKIDIPSHVRNADIGDYTYVSMNSWINNTRIGKFCSIGPNLLCGWGVHPTQGISTSPMFYSTKKQNGITFSSTDKIEERAIISIGNDVFIGANVTILDGVSIGDGAIIGAGAVVSKDIPPYAIAVGVPIQIVKYRFSEEQIQQLLKIKWWDFEESKLRDIESNFFNVDAFLSKNKAD
ncbi:MAG TPA: chloramphenicol acetyltransferase [Bacteroidales bacterium]|nr:chloramphenicol acetyltransferase [Bacteroidales bacterium]HCB62090.1 chloramphenicol acetyltransferase [Bacteroidales bacterium]HCY22318.1 chloramphenicol acetyltransferase [Bacteroidales bacterium]